MAQPRISLLRGAESEKITINLGFVDLDQIDLIVSDGFYANRTDFIRTAIRTHLDKHREALAKSLERKHFDLGLHDYSRECLEALRQSGQTVNIRVIGLARIADDVSAELARSTIASVAVLGAFQATSAVINGHVSGEGDQLAFCATTEFGHRGKREKFK